MPVLALALHAERIYSDGVWNRTRRLALAVSQLGGALTFFVYPYRAQVAGKDISQRVRWLASHGHEVAQHTHFYAGQRTEGPTKSTDLSEGNIRRCLQADQRTLRSMGCVPRGFTAGAWHVNDSILRSLVEMGIEYDSSARLRSCGSPATPQAHHLWLTAPRLWNQGERALLLLPTTCSIGQWFRWGRRIPARESCGYQSVYLHDYDLLKPATLAMTWLFSRLHGRHFTPMARIADGFLEEGVSGDTAERQVRPAGGLLLNQ
jgi:hypothetical protein